MKPLFSVIYIQ